MAEYRVTFFNNLLNPNGLPVKCSQRSLTVQGKDPEEASLRAQRAFERLEGVPDWKCHAHFYEIEIAQELTAARGSRHRPAIAASR
jgi:hypothetical protein